MALTLNGSSNVITGLAVGGLPDGIVDNDMIANTTIAEGKLAANVNTITEVDQWRVTASFTTDDADPIGANWERTDTNFTKIGTGMTESSGVFTFPSTGIWRVDFGSYQYQTASTRRFVGYGIYDTTNNGTNWYARTFTYSSYQAHATWPIFSSGFATAILDITNTSNHKVRFRVNTTGDVIFAGSTDENYTFALFTRLGDT